MTHPLVEQLRFTRSEWARGLDGVSEEDGLQHFGPMNSISWTVGHLAWHEHRYFVQRAQNKVLFPQLHETFRPGSPMSTPSLTVMLDVWRRVTQAADPYLNGLTTAALQEMLPHDPPLEQSVGSALQRVIYHYWYHIGEIQAMRQMLGQGDLPEYVGDIEVEAPYQPE